MSCKMRTIQIKENQIYALNHPKNPDKLTYKVLEVAVIKNYPQFNRIILQEEKSGNLLDYNEGKLLDSIEAGIYVLMNA